MWRMLAKRLVALVLSVVLATGVAAYSVRAGDTAAAAVTAVTAEMPMPASRDGCAGDQKATPTACDLLCANAVPLPSVAVVFKTVPVGTVGPTVLRVALGHITPPDTPPPKPTDLG